MYCYGDWIDYSSETNKTDYDIFVYDPSGDLQSYHTEAAGLPEHLGTTVDHPYFIAAQSGNYSFLIKNDARESRGAEAATFMLIEHIETDKWYSRNMEGKINDQPVEKTSWSYEFNTTNSHIEVLVEVPDTIDMYEVRMYIMANPSKDVGTILNGVPLAWEQGLYGSTSGIYGGYNIDSDGFRITNAMASCEYSGDNMLINFTAPVEGNLLYHITFIAENGEGNIEFLVKTDFEAPELSLLNEIKKISPNNKTIISVHVKEQFTLETVTLNYTKDNGTTYAVAEMVATQNRIYTGTILGQPAGTLVNYTVFARDVSLNSAKVLGSYSVKNSANVTLDVSSSIVNYGENITVTGSIPVSGTNVTLTYAMLNVSALNGTSLDYASGNNKVLNYTSSGSAVSRVVPTDSSGVFYDEYSLNKTGKWFVWVTWNGSETYFGASSDYRNVTVQKVYIEVTCNIMSSSLPIGDNITVRGSVYPIIENLTVNVIFTDANLTNKQTTYTDMNGTYRVSWKTDSMGLWQVHANIAENDSISATYSNVSTFTVTETFLNQYLLYIIGGVAGVAGVSVVVFIRRRREYE